MSAIKAVLSDGREVSGSTDKMTVKEWRELKSPAYSTANDDAIVCKCYPSISASELLDLPFDDYRRLVLAIFEGLRAPIEKNSQSAST